MCRVITRIVIAALVAALEAGSAAAGQDPPSIGQPQPVTPALPPGAPLTLQDALTQARANSQQFRSAQLASNLAVEDRKQARAALLPSLSGFSQFIGTQPNGTPSGIFVANDGPKVYNDWLLVHGELFSPGKWAEYRSAAAAEAVARAKADVAGRGLVATVVTNYYTLVAAQRKLSSTQQGLREAQQFLEIAQRQEAGGEVAHSDVIKAQIQVAQRLRDAQEAELAALKSRLTLSVLVFPDYRDQFAVVDDLQTIAPLPTIADLNAAATGNSPDVRAAEASVQQESSAVGVARGAVLPVLSFDYFYGINANQFAITNPEGQNLLGSVVQVQLTVPIWNWGAGQSKLRQANLRVQAAKAELTLADHYLQGEGVTPSCAQARVLLEAAAKRGSTEAKQKLGDLAQAGCQ